ncbi:hypothetical protein [Plesiomonas shigelloides]|uniref:hypothetical protein n=1 Tax=Plesiomonas shigelloides TaxID=703 RepID=UPI000579CD96|nr:hypothetical protein [Plesiomonas shigelloides]
MELKDFFEKLSSYNIFNHLLPGALFCIVATKTSDINFLQPDILSSFFVYYFAGVIISRVGSVIVHPTLEKIGFIKFAPYKEYIQASKKDSKIETLSETNNMYRTTISLFFCLLILRSYEWLIINCPLISEHKTALVFIVFMITFSIAYKKQTKYIKDRVEEAKDK